MLEVGNGGMTADEYRTHMSLWCMLSAPLMAGNDLRTITEETKSILMNPDLIAIDQDRDPEPVQRLSQQGKSEVLVQRQRIRGRPIQPRSPGPYKSMSGNLFMIWSSFGTRP
jgi:hypothetical protein